MAKNSVAEWFDYLAEHPLVQKSLPYLRQKYAIAIIIFLIWVLFIDNNNLFERIDAMSNMHKLEVTKAYYEEKLETDAHMLNDLKTNGEVLERYARENYLMKRAEEDIFLLEEKE
ncbi:MAG: hypothetical protein RIS47_1019 [Bacteroidota bacterium]|jgi:hypothetical protein